MKKFRLVKEYPNSPKIRTVAEFRPPFNYVDSDGNEYFQENIESYPNFWREIKEDDRPKVSISEIKDVAMVEAFKIAKKLTKFKPFEELSETDKVKLVKLKIESKGYDALFNILNKM